MPGNVIRQNHSRFFFFFFKPRSKPRPGSATVEVPVLQCSLQNFSALRNVRSELRETAEAAAGYDVTFRDDREGKHAVMILALGTRARHNVG